MQVYLVTGVKTSDALASSYFVSTLDRAYTFPFTFLRGQLVLVK